MIASILQEAGYKVGLYTSPHLKNFTERIRINGEGNSQTKSSFFYQSASSFFRKTKVVFF